MKTLQQRFDEKVMPEPNSGCHLWVGATTSAGYGAIRVGSKTYSAHRVSWELHNGTIPEIEGSDYRGACVAHRCDVPLCVNPDHLFISTHSENIDDRSIKDRAWSKLNWLKVAEIRDDNRLHREIAEDYGVARSVITRIKNQKLWRTQQANNRALDNAHH